MLLINPNFQSFFEALLVNNFCLVPDVNTSLADLTAPEFTLIGKALSVLLLANTSPEAAVDEYIHRFPALQQLDTQNDWFRPMMVVIGTKILTASLKGGKIRVYGGAALSILDMISDTIMIMIYFQTGQIWAAWAMIASISINMVSQLFIVVIQNRRMGGGVLLIGIVTTLFCLKPAIDPHNVATGKKQHRNEQFCPETEMACSRGIELVTEGVPGLIFQIYAMLLSGSWDARAGTSVIISGMTIANTATLMTWDYDTSPTLRDTDPSFCGFIKNDSLSRTLTYLAMLSLSLSHVLMKALSTSLLYIVSGYYLATYLLIDVGLFFATKICGSDFRYWMHLPDPLQLVFSFFTRLFTKLLADYTCTLQLRHPQELGELYFSWNIIQNHLAVFVSTWIYLNHDFADITIPSSEHSTSTNNSTTIPNLNSTEFTDLANFNDNTNADNTLSATTPFPKLDAGVLLAVDFCLFLLFLFSATTLFLIMNPHHRKTFIDPITSRNYLVKTYFSAKTNRQKMDLFTFHPSYYESIKPELQAYLAKNWKDWMANRPDWLTERLISLVPDELLPAEEVEKLNKASVGGVRRKSSVADVMGFGSWRRGGGGGASVAPQVEVGSVGDGLSLIHR